MGGRWGRCSWGSQSVWDSKRLPAFFLKLQWDLPLWNTYKLYGAPGADWHTHHFLVVRAGSVASSARNWRWMGKTAMQLWSNRGMPGKSRAGLVQSFLLLYISRGMVGCQLPFVEYTWPPVRLLSENNHPLKFKWTRHCQTAVCQTTFLFSLSPPWKPKHSLNSGRLITINPEIWEVFHFGYTWADLKQWF